MDSKILRIGLFQSSAAIGAQIGTVVSLVIGNTNNIRQLVLVYGG